MLDEFGFMKTFRRSNRHAGNSPILSEQTKWLTMVHLVALYPSITSFEGKSLLETKKKREEKKQTDKKFFIRNALGLHDVDPIQVS
jgi:hypothetical protein